MSPAEKEDRIQEILRKLKDKTSPRPKIVHGPRNNKRDQAAAKFVLQNLLQGREVSSCETIVSDNYEN